MRSIVTSALILGLLGAGATLAPPAHAQRMRAQIYLTQHRLPRSQSERQLLGWARGHQTTRLQETREANLEDRKWIAELIVNFNRPPDDLEFHILYYDTQDGPRRFVDDQTIYVNDRSQRTYVQRLNLTRPRFAPNRRMEMVVTVRREEVGRKAFQMLGEERRRTGEVSFSDEEANPELTMQQQQQAQATETPAEDPLPDEEMTDAELGLSGDGPGAFDDLAAGAGGESSAPPEAASDSRGCGCSTAGDAAGAWPVVALLALLGLRRRRLLP
jgi:MYXO-CTERM domain-containing protein